MEATIENFEGDVYVFVEIVACFSFIYGSPLEVNNVYKRSVNHRRNGRGLILMRPR